MYADPEGLRAAYCDDQPWLGGCGLLEGGGGGAARGGMSASAAVRAILCSISGMCNLNEDAESDSPTPPRAGVCDDAGGTQGTPDPEDDENTEHAKQRMKERGISQDRVDEAKKIGRVKPGNTEKEIVYEVPSSQSDSGRGIRVVVDKGTGKTITVIDKGQNFR